MKSIIDHTKDMKDCFLCYVVEQKSRADFAPDIELPLSKLTATDNIML
jgi:hypothetical protein